MPSAADHAAPAPSTPDPAASVFISYASEDRPAARTLRDTLLSAGLDVWYDEQELTGGDAWDQKIRRQIRDCDYFMPLISATTEARSEGYFRREWRLACERSLDMADDVLFIVPVVIDDTPDQGARVPDKFFTVQWLRARGGHATPAMHHLIRRMLARERHMAPRTAAGPTRAPFQRTQAPLGAPPPLAAEPPPGVPPPIPPGAAAHAAPPPMPPMPHVPENAGFLHGVKFLFEVLWWALTAAWLLFNRLPKWARIVVTVWLVLTLFSIKCSNVRTNVSERPRAGEQRPPPGRPPSDGPKKMRNLIERISQSARDGKFTGDPEEFAKFVGDLARGFDEGFNEAAAAGKSLVIVPFGPPDASDPGDKFAHAVFISLYGRIALERRSDVGVAAPPKGELDDAALIARGQRLGATFVLTARATAAAPYTLTVRLLKVADGTAAWTETYPVDDNDATNVAEQLAAKLREHLPRKEPHKEKLRPPPVPPPDPK
ncbi:MAG: toll/interleukin-1 receptor domain-containing protein [Verrucomicrobia bacterium]|nr:toll/interleukin-1 receptor domain-containing protein [Verrucomicrobiota bacterium]